VEGFACQVFTSVMTGLFPKAFATADVFVEVVFHRFVAKRCGSPSMDSTPAASTIFLASKGLGGYIAADLTHFD
jgi:hypothetical protein